MTIPLTLVTATYGVMRNDLAWEKKRPGTSGAEDGCDSQQGTGVVVCAIGGQPSVHLQKTVYYVHYPNNTNPRRKCFAAYPSGNH